MCYSKEVQLITSLIILCSTLFYYFYYSKRYQRSSKKWLLPFLNSLMLVFLSIGLHQFFEFLSLVTNSQIIYKLGLIISVSAVYFMLLSLERLSNRKLYSWIALIPIAFISVHLFFSTLYFAAASFYVRHNSTFLWATTWLFLFIYWHICAIKIYTGLNNRESKRKIIVYLLAVADISFILSVIYVIIGYFFFSVNVCTDSPSIWCTFYVIQTILLPFLLFKLDRWFYRPNKPQKTTLRQFVTYLIISFLILVTLALTLPFFHCLTWKFVFP